MVELEHYRIPFAAIHAGVPPQVLHDPQQVSPPDGLLIAAPYVPVPVEPPPRDARPAFAAVRLQPVGAAAVLLEPGHTPGSLAPRTEFP